MNYFMILLILSRHSAARSLSRCHFNLIATPSVSPAIRSLLSGAASAFRCEFYRLEDG